MALAWLLLSAPSGWAAAGFLIPSVIGSRRTPRVKSHPDSERSAEMVRPPLLMSASPREI